MPTKDSPATDPNVKALGNFDVCALSVAELKAAGVILTPHGFPPTSGRQWFSHSEYEGRDRDHAVMARGYARRQAFEHVARHGSLEGLRLQRSFPCLGTFRLVLDTGRGHVVVACDVCGEEMGVAWPRDDHGTLGPFIPPTMAF